MLVPYFLYEKLDFFNTTYNAVINVEDRNKEIRKCFFFNFKFLITVTINFSNDKV